MYFIVYVKSLLFLPMKRKVYSSSYKRFFQLHDNVKDNIALFDEGIMIFTVFANLNTV
jgi:hypothetical protein